jgi:hypothetical protein
VDSAERDVVLDLLSRLAPTAIGSRLVLVGSAGLLSASGTIPPLTEGVDLLLDADWAASNEDQVLEILSTAGFRHLPETSTFVSASGLTLDLVGYSSRDRTDRVGGGARLPVRVYADLSTLMSAGGATGALTAGGLALTAAALAAVKLLTLRVEHRSKDKLQALLLIAENAGVLSFFAELRRLISCFEPDRLERALADAQAVVLSLSIGPQPADPQVRGYVGMRDAAEQGLRHLRRVQASIAEAGPR